MLHVNLMVITSKKHIKKKIYIYIKPIANNQKKMRKESKYNTK